MIPDAVVYALLALVLLDLTLRLRRVERRTVRVTRFEGPRPLQLDELRPGLAVATDRTGRPWTVLRVDHSFGPDSPEVIRLELTPTPTKEP